MWFVIMRFMNFFAAIAKFDVFFFENIVKFMIFWEVLVLEIKKVMPNFCRY